MRPPPVILSGVHWNSWKCASGVPIVGATALRCGSQLHTTSAAPMGAASSARLLTLTIAFASANVGVACGGTKNANAVPLRSRRISQPDNVLEIVAWLQRRAFAANERRPG